MNKRTVCISNQAHLSVEHQQMIVFLKENEDVKKVPIEDLAILILDHPAITYTHYLLVALSNNNVVVVVCDDKHLPTSLVLSLSSHTTHSRIIKLQADMPKPVGKALWQQIIKAKIAGQVHVLKSLKLNSERLQRLIIKVRSGDPDNCEAQAAQYYWTELFGTEFRRDRDLPGINSLLNYGYMIIRSAVARAIVGTGLHPSLGIFHRNQYNPFCLADDLLEPLRPLVDITVYDLCKQFYCNESVELNKEIKQQLIRLMEFYINFKDQKLPMTVALDLYAATVKKFICQEIREIAVPQL